MVFIDVITVLNKSGKKFWKTKSSGLTRSCKLDNADFNSSCPMFCILKSDFDIKLKKMNVCNKNGYNKQVMKTIQTMLGLPKKWGKYSWVIHFKIPIEHLYRPLNLNGVVYMIKPNIKYINKSNYIKELSKINLDNLPNNIIKHKIQQQMNNPFVGNGDTLLVGDISLDLKFSNLHFKVFVIPGNIQMSNITFYDSYIQYIFNNHICSL